MALPADLSGIFHQKQHIFDAKYRRLNPAYEGIPYAVRYGAPGPEEDDINTMHRYRDAIVFENQATGNLERPWQVVRRHEIKARRPHPGTENKLYVLFQIESWKSREVSIRPGGYGIYA